VLGTFRLVTQELTIAAFNAHFGVGRSGDERGVRFDVAEVVRGFGADIAVIAECWRDDDGKGIVDELAEEGYAVEYCHMMALERRRDRGGRRDAAPRAGIWELAVLSRFPIVARREIVLGTIKGDPVGSRRALEVTTDVNGVPLDVIGVHTSSRLHTLAPLRHLYGLKRQLTNGVPQLIAGDFNFWGPPIGLMMPEWKRPVRGRTWPANKPHSQIDHVLVRGAEPIDGEVLAATSSDHRPVRARVRLVAGTRSRS
jgi:endonuclease/exonuclease/phosphatase family metal-dependent hydrolase